MKFVLMSDIHATSKNPIARKDDIQEAFLSKFEFALKYAHKNYATILQAGDFFHRPRDWRLLGQSMDLLDKYDVQIYTIYGQHDMYMYSDVEESPTTLNILDRAGFVVVLDKEPTVLQDGVHLYGCSYGRKVPRPRGKHNILVIHAPISKKDLFPEHDYTSPEYFMRKNPKYDLVLAGDIHRQFVSTGKRGTLVNTGPLLRYDGSEYNMIHQPSIFLWDTEYRTLQKVQVPHQPASKVLTRGHIEKSRDITDALASFTEVLEGTEVDTYDARQIIELLVKKMKVGKRVKKILAEVMEDD